MANIKISQLPAKGANLEATDLVEISEFNGSGYVSKSITGQEIIDAASGGSGVTDVTATSPIVSTGGATPDISITQAGATDDGYLSTGDWNAFNNKQDALVSGTNIKTINGSSVLGSGNLTISGTGLQGLNNIFGSFPTTNLLIDTSVNATNPGSLSFAANTLVLFPFIPNKTTTSISLKINVTTLGVGANARILIYSDLNGFPNTKLYESTNLDCSTTGIKTATTIQTFTAGTTYWLAYHASAAVSITTTTVGGLLPLFFIAANTNPATGYQTSISFGSAPTNYTYTGHWTGMVPKIYIQTS